MKSSKSDYYLEQFARMKRWYDLLNELSKGADKVDFNFHRDVAYAFFQNCYHLKDWIKESLPAEKRAVEKFVHSSIEMGICQNICTGSKHLTINNPAYNPATHLDDLSDIDVPISVGREYDRFAKEDGKQIDYKIFILAGGKKHDCMKVATECMNLWRTFLGDRSLLSIK